MAMTKEQRVARRAEIAAASSDGAIPVGTVVTPKKLPVKKTIVVKQVCRFEEGPKPEGCRFEDSEPSKCEFQEIDLEPDWWLRAAHIIEISLLCGLVWEVYGLVKWVQ